MATYQELYCDAVKQFESIRDLASDKLSQTSADEVIANLDATLLLLETTIGGIETKLQQLTMDLLALRSQVNGL